MEYVGKCSSCGKNVYCESGFLNGRVDDDHQLFCMQCSEKQSYEQDNSAVDE